MSPNLPESEGVQMNCRMNHRPPIIRRFFNSFSDCMKPLTGDTLSGLRETQMTKKFSVYQLGR